MSTGDELKAAMSARRDLGPDFEDAVVESFLDKMGQEIDRRVDERLAASPQGRQAARSGPNDAQRLALAIVSLSLGTVITLVLVLAGAGGSYLIPIWLGIIIVNAIFNGSRGKG
ncbi:hypothetical protein FE391_09070 [Nonomuraea sp. KC401]|uniref:Uncharacterized protein n=1 Tax=Nonomuraea longispora TaxID=1848320 RepID=A0A4V2XLQ1_9ACTN|nr:MULTISPECIES: hypothetical protein [Nonomuraea]NBE92547.1 hypothetical protein [Nonomuraea sp. K271]TDC11276.1 hypothetical protein E1267_00995 [Nonomuraea longispora]TLF79745.1 hypothetical protein FE391_09070 [Nonomuraea sp. KC401]